MRWENEGQVGSNSYKYIFMAAQASLQPVITSSSVITHPHEDIEYHPHDIIIIVAMILMMTLVAQLLHGAGAAPLYTLGVTYIGKPVLIILMVGVNTWGDLYRNISKHSGRRRSPF